MLIRLEHQGTVVYEIDSDEVQNEVEIGRSRQCAWAVPAEDKIISSRHARLFRMRGVPWIEDLGSSNGTFCRGKRISRKKLKPGDRITIGGCVLCVDAGSKAKTGPAIPEVVVLSGRTRGQRKEIRGTKFTVGSDPESGLVFLDPLVSRHHAEITIKEDGGCWLKDLGSKNGTSVGGSPLRSGQERLLKEGDKISVAHYELCFHDGTSKRSNLKVWVRLGVIAATILLVGGLYWTYQHLKPSAKTFLSTARQMAASENFAEARKALDHAATARRAQENRLELEEMTRLVSLWESTLDTWRGARDQLDAGDWVAAAQGLGGLHALKKEAWTWSPEAIDEKNAAMRAKTMLDTLLHATASLKRDDVPFSAMRDELSRLKGVLAESSESAPKYMDKLRVELLDAQRRLEAFLTESAELETALDSLSEWPPPIDAVVPVLEKTHQDAKGMLKRRCELMMDPVKSLAYSLKQYNHAVTLTQQMDFDQATRIDLRLPPTGDCALDSRVSAARSNIENAFEKLKIQANQLTYLFREIGKLMAGSSERVPPSIAAWENLPELDRVFACDSFQGPLPRRSRNEASGAYDRYLGVEDFHDFLMTLVLHQHWSGKSSTPFATVLFQSENIVSGIDAIIAFFEKEDWAARLTPVNTQYAQRRLDDGVAQEQPEPVKGEKVKENIGLLKGPLADKVTELRSILGARDSIVSNMLAQARDGTGRTAIMAAGIAYRLSSDPKRLTIKEQSLEAWIVSRMEENRSEVRKLGQDYDLSPPERQLVLREEILRKGIPGDPVVRRMWSSHAASQR